MTTLKQQVKVHYEQQGYLVADVERPGWKGRSRHDLFGFADLMALRPELGMGGHPAKRLLIQVCGESDRREHWRKVLTGDSNMGSKVDKQIPIRAIKCLRAGFEIVMVTASQTKPPMMEYVTREHLADPDTTMKRLKTIRQIEALKKGA